MLITSTAGVTSVGLPNGKSALPTNLGPEGIVFDVPTELGQHLLQFPGNGWRLPIPGDFADPADALETPLLPVPARTTTKATKASKARKAAGVTV